MKDDTGRVTRTTIFAAVLLVALMVGTTVPLGHDKGVDLSASAPAAAANGNRLFTVGLLGFQGDVSTLNPFLYTMMAEYMVIWPCYSTLITYDVDGQRIGDLADSWSVSPDGLTWNFNLARNAYFVDPAAPTAKTHQVTADDVMWTFWEIQNYTANHLHSYFPGVIDRMWKDDLYTLHIQTKYPYAPFLGAVTTIPILPKYIWAAQDPLRFSNVPPIGSGAFYYGLPGMPTTEALLKRNPIWFQEQNKGWQLHIDTLKIRSETDTGTALIELQGNVIDVMLSVPPSVYLDPSIWVSPLQKFAQSTGFVYEFNLNQMTDALRAELRAANPSGWHGTNSQLLLIPVVKEALAMSVDKTGFVTQVLQGLGSPADSLVPDVNPWYYNYGSTPARDTHVVSYDPAAARAMLNAAGWAYTTAGAPATSTTVPLAKAGGADPLSFRFYTLLPEPEWLQGANLLRDGAALAGVQLNLESKQTSQMNSIWYAADYDAWLWDWMFTPFSDPSTDVLSVATTMEIGSWSDFYYHNGTYDDLYNRSLAAVDPTSRREILNEMQRMLYEDRGCQAVSWRKELYGVTNARWTNYGDWNTKFMLLPDQGAPWLYMQIYPNNNHAPTITSLDPTFSGDISLAIPFTGSAVDDRSTSTLRYQWYWGDGTKTGWVTNPSQSHQYASDGVYTAYFAANESAPDPVTGNDYFVTWGKTRVTVSDNTNDAPSTPTISYSPLDPDTSTIVHFVGSSTDPESNPLYYTWSFGDGHSAQGAIVDHQYMTGGSYAITLSVTDNHIGTGARPVSASAGIIVAVNRPPTINVPDYPTGVVKNVPYTFTVSGSDPDARDQSKLRYTWTWGDGSPLAVTTTGTATHTYSLAKKYTLTVYLDDRSGLPGHNVSDIGYVQVRSTNFAPVITAWSASKTNPYTGEDVAFIGTARDGDGDPLRFTFGFGDGKYVVINNPSTAPDTLVTLSAPHNYALAGTYTARLYVNDGIANTTSSALTITVTANDPPSLAPLSNVVGTAGVAKSFSAVATDPDGDTLRYTWTWGDGSPPTVTTASSTTHTYAAAGTYTFAVYVDDLHGHNVSSSATASIAFVLNLVPGWNMVSLPLVGFGYKASTLGLLLDDVVSGWNGTAYNQNYIVGRSPARNDFAIAESTGYWIYAGAAETILIYGTVPTGAQTKTVTVPAGGGWAMIGFSGLNTTRHASDINGMYVGGTVTTVAYYNTATGLYRVYIGTPRTDFLLAPGQGYWIYVTASGVLTYNP